MPITDQFPARHRAETLPEYPDLQVAMHTVDEGEFARQLPFSALAGPTMGKLAQGLAEQVPVTPLHSPSIPHVADSVPVYPRLHKGAQDEPAG